MSCVARRRLLIATAVLLTTPMVVEAQPSGTVFRLGFLHGGTASSAREIIAAFRDELRKLGWIEGKNIIIEYRYAMGEAQRFPALAEELVRLNVNVIVAWSTPGTLAAKSATSGIPIVFGMVSDPVASGVVASLARPGGNLTGWSNMLPETSQKLLELLKGAVPNASRIAVLFDPSNPGKQQEIKVLQAEVQRNGIVLHPVEVGNLGDINRAFASMAHDRPDGLVVLSDNVTSLNRNAIVGSVAKIQLPAIYQSSQFVDIGGLMSYGVNIESQFRRSAVYVDKILRGAKPRDLPVEQPTVFELVVNMKTAKSLLLKVPPALLVRADRVIE